MKRSTYILMISLLINGCSDLVVNKDECTDITNLTIHKKTYSPDSSMYLMSFSFDEGAFGACCNQISLLKSTDSLCHLRKFILPWIYENPIWISNKEISVDIHMIHHLTAKGNFDPSYPELEIEKINGISLRKTFFNKVEKSDKRNVLKRTLNPSGSLELVCYEYEHRFGLDDSIVHISILPLGKPLPRYGNLYIIREKIYRNILELEWLSDKSICLTLPKVDTFFGQIEYNTIERTIYYPKVVNEIEKKIEYK